MLCDTDPGRRPGCAPSVLITFINMMLFKDAVVPKDCSQYMFEGQDILQLVLLFSALLCIPVMLFGKPLFILFSKRRSQGRKIYVSCFALCIITIYLFIKLLIIMIYFMVPIIFTNKNTTLRFLSHVVSITCIHEISNFSNFDERRRCNRWRKLSKRHK